MKSRQIPLQPPALPHSRATGNDGFTSYREPVTDLPALGPALALLEMNIDSISDIETQDTEDTRPILVVPYVWIGDFVRGQTVVRVLRKRWPNRPVDLLTSSLCAPLVDYMPGVRSAIVFDLPRSRLALARQRELAAEFRKRNYATALG